MTDSKTTTIALPKSVKDRLDKRKLDGETYGEAVKRLCDENGPLWTRAEVEEIARDVLREEQR